MSITPRHLIKYGRMKYLDIQDICLVRYISTNQYKKIQFTPTSHMFIVLLEGRKIFYTPEGEVQIDSNSAFFARKGTYMGSEKLSDTGHFRSMVFFLADNFIQTFITKYSSLLADAQGEFINLFTMEIDPMLQNHIKSMLLLFEGDMKGSRELLRLKMEELLLLMSRSPQGLSFLKNILLVNTVPKIDLQQFMLENYTKPCYLEEFASLSGRSLTAFKSEFQNLFGMPPKKWINRKRIETASQLLRHTSKSITDIAFESGFDSPSYFSSVFKQLQGSSPKAFKMTVS